MYYTILLKTPDVLLSTTKMNFYIVWIYIAKRVGFAKGLLQLACKPVSQ